MSQKYAQSVSRRKVFKLTAQALAATSIATGSVAADRSEQTTSANSSIVSLEGDSLVYDESGQPPFGTETTEEGMNPDLEDELQSAINGLNNARSDGKVEFEEREGEVWVVSKEPGRGDNLNVLCGENSYSTGSTFGRGPYIQFKFDDDLSRDIAALMASGAAAGAIAAKISAAIGAAPATLISAIAAILSGLGAALIHENNEGCGVRIRNHTLLPPVPGIGVTLRPQ